MTSKKGIGYLDEINFLTHTHMKMMVDHETNDVDIFLFRLGSL